MKDNRAYDQSPANAPFLANYYAAAIRAWNLERDGRQHGCRRKARWIAEHFFRACKLCGAVFPAEVVEKAHLMLDFGKFADMERKLQ